MVTINPAECDRTTVYTGECRNFQDTEWITFDSGRRRSPNAHDGNEWLLDVGVGSIWTSDDQVRNLVRLVPAREVTHEDRGVLWALIRDELRREYPSATDDDHRTLDIAASAAADAVVAHLNANGGVPASREGAALADRLERQAATIGELQGSFLRVERDAARWRRAYEIVEGERDLARERLREHLFGVEAEPADPVEQKAAGWAAAVGIDWGHAEPEDVDLLMKVAAHVLGQGDRHVDQ